MSRYYWEASTAGAFSSPEDFAANDVLAHAARVHGVAVRLAGGADDSFCRGAGMLARMLAGGADVRWHTGRFFSPRQPASIALLAARTGRCAPSGGA